MYLKLHIELKLTDNICLSEQRGPPSRNLSWVFSFCINNFRFLILVGILDFWLIVLNILLSAIVLSDHLLLLLILHLHLFLHYLILLLRWNIWHAVTPCSGSRAEETRHSISAAKSEGPNQFEHGNEKKRNWKNWEGESRFRQETIW
jgi:hypothetical protein